MKDTEKKPGKMKQDPASVFVSPDASFLKPSSLMDLSHPRLRETVSGLGKRSGDPLRDLFYLIRDDVRYVFVVPRREDAFMASSILKARRGFCTQKAILFCSLARMMGVPAGIWFYDIIDATLDQKMKHLLKTQTLFHHGVAALWLKNRWIRMDATLDSTRVRRNRLYPVEYRRGEDCFLPSHTTDGKRHIEYVRDHGLRSDVTFQQIMDWFHEAYPHLF